jgi:DNA repair photolyase
LDILSFQRSFLSSYSINPYENCVFNCRYCYISERFGEEFGKYSKPVENITDQIENNRFSIQTESVMLSAYTDPYPPIEKKKELTRECLKKLIDIQPRLLILSTRSPLIIRDEDLIKKVKNISVSISIGTDVDSIAKMIEPGAPSPSARFRAAKKLKDLGIKVRILVAPLIKHTDQFANKIQESANSVFIETNLINSWSVSATPEHKNLIEKNGDSLIEKLSQFFSSSEIEFGKLSLITNEKISNKTY